jgi:teichuronic acid exporter
MHAPQMTARGFGHPGSPSHAISGAHRIDRSSDCGSRVPIPHHMPEPLKQKVISGLVWRGMERVGTQAVQFIIAIILARLLPVKDFGTIAIVTVFIGFAQLFVDSGFGMALIQKKEIEDRDYNSAFYLNLAIALATYLICFFGAPLVAAFYKEEVLIGALRLAALSLIIGVFSSIQQAVMNREMKFKLSLRVSLISLLLSSTTGITFAYSGFGVWSLVYAQLTGATATAVLLWLAVSWRPRVMFSAQSARALFKFGSKYLLARIITELFNNLSTLFIGKCFSLSTLSLFSRGFLFPLTIVMGVCGTMDGVLFPALASCQHDKNQMKGIQRRSISTSTFIIFPLLAGLAVVAKPLIIVLLTEKWLSSSLYLQISCLTVAFWPVLGINVQALNASGRSDVYMKMEIFNKGIGLAILFATLPYGIIAVVIGQAAHSVLMCLVCYPWINGRYLGYSPVEQMRDILPALGCALGMGIVILPLALLLKNQLLLLVIQIGGGAICYAILCHLFKVQSLAYLLAQLHEKLPGIKQVFSRTPAPAAWPRGS